MSLAIPHVPGHTCPTIDAGIRAARKGNVDIVVACFEQLRKDNLSFREGLAAALALLDEHRIEYRRNR